MDKGEKLSDGGKQCHGRDTYQMLGEQKENSHTPPSQEARKTSPFPEEVQFICFPKERTRDDGQHLCSTSHAVVPLHGISHTLAYLISSLRQVPHFTDGKTEA